MATTSFLILIFHLLNPSLVQGGFGDTGKYSAQIKAISVQEKKALIPDYLISLAKELKCKDMKSCNDIFSKMIKKELLKFLDLVDKKVDMKKAPKSFKDSIDKLKAVVKKAKEKAKEEARTKAEKMAKEKAKKETEEKAKLVAQQTKNPCPVVREVQFEPIPSLPQPTKLCFGNYGTSTIEEKPVKMVLFPKKSLQLPQYAFKKSVKCPSSQVAAVKADASGVECVDPGKSKFEFTYDFCPAGFVMIPRPEDADSPKFCFGFLSQISAYVIWPYNLSSSTYAAIPEAELGVNQQCDYSSGFSRSLDKGAKTIQCQYNDLLFDVENPDAEKKAIEGYRLPNRYSIVFPMPNLDGKSTSPPHPDQGSAAVVCAQSTYATSTFYKARVQICRQFTGAASGGQHCYGGFCW